MKKKIIISLSVVAFILLIFIVNIVLCIIKSNNLKDEIDSKLTQINEYATKIYLYDKGEMKVNANYKGAHGESFPSEFNYNYELRNNLITLSDNGNYYERELDLSIINIFKKINKDLFNIKKKEYGVNTVKLILDEEKINNIFNSNYKNIYITYEDKIKLILDNDYINIKDNILDGIINNNSFKLTLNDNKYSLNINDKLKMNAFVKDNKYNIIINGNVYTLEYSDHITINFSSRAAIYNSINIDIYETNNELIKNKELEDEEEIPMIRYLNKVEKGVLK